MRDLTIILCSILTHLCDRELRKMSKRLYNGTPKYTRVYLLMATGSHKSWVTNAILSQFPKDPEDSITWSDLWAKVNAKKNMKNRIGSKKTLSRCLEHLCYVGLVIKEARGYRLSSAYSQWKRQPEPRLEWRGKTIEDKQAFLDLLEIQLTFILDSYIEMLDGLVDIEAKWRANEWVSSFFKIMSIEDQLTSFAISVWKKRETLRVRLKDIRENGGLYPVLRSGADGGRKAPLPEYYPNSAESSMPKA